MEAGFGNICHEKSVVLFSVPKTIVTCPKQIFLMITMSRLVEKKSSDHGIHEINSLKLRKVGGNNGKTIGNPYINA